MGWLYVPILDTEVQVAYSHRIQEARERAQQELDTKVVEAYKHSEAKKKKQLQDSMEKVNSPSGHCAAASSETPAVNTDTFVTQLVNSTPVVVFSKTYCPYCKNAKRALSAYRIPDSFYRIIELDGRDDCDQIQDILLQKTGTRTVPRVFIGGKCVGGADDTIAAQRDGRLEKMLKEVGAI
uniref:Glutaredoxin domain-containing protein n=1 Tax=Setaria digitata TaxID=48799 RepID=A0A915PQG8_9BILA